jgi:tetratricopeptide (TPR) repeat protein
VRRAQFLWVIALGAFGLAGLGLGAGWTYWRRDADMLARGDSAYARGEFTQAADLARRRLKAAPGDVAALRLLARATARLGRDTAANALFARLGSAALQAEDLYLLGLGLDHAGQQDAARRVWERALELQPDHPETMAQLIIHESSRNRLAQAAVLAERLARQPGWEFRSALDLGTFRAELSDPAGAAVVLKQALERPEAAGLDRATATHYRKLLARTLLRIARPQEARALLDDLLRGGPDAEASWLLSRAALQEGTLPEARAALRAAGSYRAEHPLELEPSPYVGEAQCSGCHRDTFRAVQSSRHAATFVQGKALTTLPYPDHPLTDPDDPAIRHAFRLQGDQVQVETRVVGKVRYGFSAQGELLHGHDFEIRDQDKVRHAVVAYAFGSPDHYVSLVGSDDRGQPYIFRLSHYQAARDSGWVRTTGHSPDAAGQDFLGKPLDPLDGIHKCLFCHTTDPRAVLEQSGPAAADRAIGCERCHGPGGNHLRAIAAQLPDPAIVSPGAAPAEGRLRLCGQCHSHHQELPVPRTDPFWIRFQGTTLPWSRCYTDSAGALDCTTCHDPHHDAEGAAAQAHTRCLSCHAGPPAAERKAPPQVLDPTAQVAPRGSTCPVNPAEGCIGCHMPPFESQPLHTTFTDHYIRVHTQRKPSSPK